MLLKVITTIAVTVPVFVLAAQTLDPSRGGSDGIVAIPLMKHSDTNAREFHATSHNTKIMDGSDGNEGTPHSSAVKRAGPGAGIDLTNYRFEMWYGTISIGTPPQSFNVQLNTASSDLFVPASTGDWYCRSHPNLWDPALMSRITNVDLNSKFVQVFSGGRFARGGEYTDNVTIAGFTADIQTIGAATAYSSDLGAAEFAADGLLGLAFPSLSALYAQSPLLHTLFNEGKLPQPVFSLKLTNSGGELYIGGTNEALYIQNTLVFTPITIPAIYWELKIDNIKVDGEIALTDVTAVIDTGAHFIVGDPARLLALHQAGGGGTFKNRGAFPEGQYKGYYTFPCRFFPSFTFTIGGNEFPLPEDALNVGQIVYKGKNCFSGFATVERSPTKFWLLGTMFLQQFYTVFDFNSESPRVGFANLKPI